MIDNPPEPQWQAKSYGLGVGMSDADTRELVHELARRIRGEIRFDRLSRLLYSTDASIYQIEPVGVVIPHGVEDVIATTEIAAEHNVPVIPRGGGTSLVG